MLRLAIGYFRSLVKGDFGERGESLYVRFEKMMLKLGIFRSKGLLRGRVRGKR
jgi:hypothetical protein